jgi:hypothetical protein
MNFNIFFESCKNFKGFLLTTENSLNAYQMKLIGSDMCAFDDKNLFYHPCNFSKMIVIDF